MSIETLTDEERDQLTAQDDFPPTWVTDRALRVIDAHAAERAALVARLEAAELRAGIAEAHAKAHDCRASVAESEHDALHEKLRDAESQLAELTRERDDARIACAGLRSGLAGIESEVARLTYALAAAEREASEFYSAGLAQGERLDAAEARVREMSALLMQHGIEHG